MSDSLLRRVASMALAMCCHSSPVKMRVKVRLQAIPLEWQTDDVEAFARAECEVDVTRIDVVATVLAGNELAEFSAGKSDAAQHLRAGRARNQT